MRERLAVQTSAPVSDGQGGRTLTWSTLDTVWAALVDTQALMSLQAQALTPQSDLRFRVRVRSDVTTQMRVLWTPTWPAGAAAQTLEIQGIPLEGDGRDFMFLDCGRLPS